MTTKQEEIALKIISFLKQRGLINRNDIAQEIKEDSFENNFSTAIEYLKEEKLITEPDHHLYKITLEGSSFVSFEKLKEERSLQIQLAKSNIEANKLNAINSAQNKKDRSFNKTFLIVNAIFALINILIAILK